jgi:DNA-binding GntR family transcriptional regulator
MTSVTSSDRVFTALRTAILSGELTADSRHSIYGLATEFGVSRTPVRDAVLRLADAGLVTIERNRGIRVRGVTADGVRAVFEMRLMLEVPAAAYAASAADAELLKKLDATLTTMRDGTCHDERTFMSLDRELHRLIATPLHNGQLESELERLRDGIAVTGVSTVGRSRDLAAIAAEHVPIVAAIRSGEPREAAGQMWEHLVHTGTLLLSQVSGKSIDRSWAQRLRGAIPE